MVRQIHTGAATHEAVAENVVKQAPAPAAEQAPAEALQSDALAGALPAWDLQPATPFIRRVK